MNLTIGEKIKVLMNRQGVTVTELAAATGQTRQNLSNKLNRDNFTEKEAEVLAKALGCSVSVIFTKIGTGESI
ncbi:MULTISPECIES: helix-turn-helix transcriptional regulator [unclassified Oscillibacter]|uniref:helix-turn-helix transcriptional regulator n=1 Tax=unclassified Oscillibacter TaxID=2629304 RepID=UPI00289CCFC7|nr:helix-turn-helix transcriptional regulator [Oscillibacter sp.]